MVMHEPYLLGIMHQELGHNLHPIIWTKFRIPLVYIIGRTSIPPTPPQKILCFYFIIIFSFYFIYFIFLFWCLDIL